MAEGRETPEELRPWVETLVYEFGLEHDQVPVDAILALAGEAAHGVTRPAAPVTTFVAGLIAGRQGATPEEIADAIGAARALVADHEDDED